MVTVTNFSTLSCWLLGGGKWGQNIKRTLETANVKVKVGGTTAPTGLSAVFIATPLRTHASLALPYIQAGIPVFVEKPLCYTREETLSLVSAWWGSPKAPLLCDFQHLFSRGFEALVHEKELQKPERISFIGTLGGPGPIRSDCHPVWDYGSHLVAMALRLGLKDALIGASLQKDDKFWVIVGDPRSQHHVELSMSNTLPDKTRHATIAFNADVAGTYKEPIWLVHREFGENAGSIERYANDDRGQEPLTRAVHAFLKAVTAEKSVLGSKHDERFGLGLPLEVDAVLRRLISP